MPRTKEKLERVGVSLPVPLLEEVDRVTKEYPECAWNRSKFVEEAVREKVFYLRELKAKLNTSDARTHR